MNHLLDHALDYAAQGYEIFPVNETDKTPYTEHGMKDATTDTAQLRQWWKQHPNALIGCRIPEDVVVLDIDPRHNGGAVWLELERRHGTVKAARVHASGRGDGGRHYWFRRGDIEKVSAKPLHEWARTNGLGQPAGKRGWTSGIDVLHHGWRYTILPPSPHPETGKPYRWLQEGEPSSPPTWLGELVTKPAPAIPSTPAPSTTHEDSIADWYTATATWSEILNGWTIVEGDGESDGSKWRHPTATASASASIRHGCLFVYTPNTDLEETEDGDPHGYTKFRAWAEIHHGGDLKRAATAAREQRDGPRAELLLKPSTPATNEPLPAAQDSDLLNQLIDWPDFWNHDHGAEEWIAWPLIPAQRQVALFAPAKSGKSLVTLAVCAAVATGRDILGQRNQHGPRHVLYLDYEMTGSDLFERLEALGYGPDDDLSHLHYALLPSLPPLNTVAGSKALRDLAALVDAEVVVIDTMGRAVMGEENSADSYMDFARTTGIMLKAAGRAVLRTDHAGKNKEQGQRGSSAKNDDVDVVMRIDPAEGGWTLTRTHSRIAWAPDRVSIARNEDTEGVVRLVADTRKHDYLVGTKELVAILRGLGITAESTNRQAADVLRGAGEKGSNKRITHALRWMREELPTWGNERGTGGERGISDDSGHDVGNVGTEARNPSTAYGERSGERRGTRSDANGDQGGFLGKEPPDPSVAPDTPKSVQIHVPTVEEIF